MSDGVAPRSRLVGALFVSAGLLHCGGDGHAPPPSADAGGSGATAGSGAGEAPTSAGDGATNGSADGGAAGDNAAAGSSTSAAGATGEPSIPTLSGCKAADYVDLSADDAERTILIAAEGLTFSPKCMIVSVAQTVTWQGSLSAHPLAPGNSVDANAGSPGNPIPITTSGTSVDVAFPIAGTFPYFCQLHSFDAGQGMAGVVHVQR